MPLTQVPAPAAPTPNWSAGRWTACCSTSRAGGRTRSTSVSPSSPSWGTSAPVENAARPAPRRPGPLGLGRRQSLITFLTSTAGSGRAGQGGRPGAGGSSGRAAPDPAQHVIERHPQSAPGWPMMAPLLIVRVNRASARRITKPRPREAQRCELFHRPTTRSRRGPPAFASADRHGPARAGLQVFRACSTVGWHGMTVPRPTSCRTCRTGSWAPTMRSHPCAFLTCR